MTTTQNTEILAMNQQTPILSTSTVPSYVLEARQARADVQKAYNKAVTLCQTQLINETWPRLHAATMAVLDAERRAGLV